MLRRQCPSLRSPCQIGKTSKLEACQIIAKHSLTTAKEMITHINTYYTLNPRKYTINFSPPRFHCHGLRPRQHGNLVTHPNVVLDVIDHSQISLFKGKPPLASISPTIWLNLVHVRYVNAHGNALKELPSQSSPKPQTHL